MTPIAPQILAHPRGGFRAHTASLMHACSRGMRVGTPAILSYPAAPVAANTRALSRLNLAGGIDSSSDVVSRNDFKLFRDRRLLVSYDGRVGLRTSGRGVGGKMRGVWATCFSPHQRDPTGYTNLLRAKSRRSSLFVPYSAAGASRWKTCGSQLCTPLAIKRMEHNVSFPFT